MLSYYLTLIINGYIEVKEMNNLCFNLSSSSVTDNSQLDSSQNNIKAIIKLFHLDVILIYTALLLKRKIAIYHHSKSTLLDFMSALPSFISHRTENSNKILYPNVDLYSEEQIDWLKGNKIKIICKK